MVDICDAWTVRGFEALQGMRTKWWRMNCDSASYFQVVINCASCRLASCAQRRMILCRRNV
eukprot:4615868-Pyramimonas_sp.AAC.1